MIIFDSEINIDTIADKIEKSLEEELKASAAGFPGAQDDITTYAQYEMFKSNPTLMTDHLIKRFNIKV